MQSLRREYTDRRIMLDTNTSPLRKVRLHLGLIHHESGLAVRRTKRGYEA
jgi:hypothetical protein